MAADRGVKFQDLLAGPSLPALLSFSLRPVPRNPVIWLWLVVSRAPTLLPRTPHNCVRAPAQHPFWVFRHSRDAVHLWPLPPLVGSKPYLYLAMQAAERRACRFGRDDNRPCNGARHLVCAIPLMWHRRDPLCPRCPKKMLGCQPQTDPGVACVCKTKSQDGTQKSRNSSSQARDDLLSDPFGRPCPLLFFLPMPAGFCCLHPVSLR